MQFSNFRIAEGVLLLVLLLSARGVLAAEEGPISTDRPGQSDSTAILSPGYFQIETGWQYTEDDVANASFQQHQVLGTLLRAGFRENLELRLFWAGYLSEEVRFGNLKRDSDGAGDASAGVRWRLREENGRLPSVAILGNLSLPVGEDAFTSDRFDPSFKIAASNSLPAGFSLTYNLGIAWSSATDSRGEVTTLSTGAYTLSLGRGLSDRVSAFLEAYGSIPASAPGRTTHALDGGFAYLVKDNLQLDFSAGVGLSDESPDWFAALGLSVRLPR